ncbi:SbcC/MukB-like Walker B domain-containing protein [Salegentibacter sp. HM20]
MKILRIEFENINSLKGKHQIDFTREPFNQSSLFAITGPTGSGKSTLLDVIALALFNNIPRMDKVSTPEILKTGAIITRNQQEAMAAVTYQGKAGIFRSQWSISTNRNGNLRDYEMEVANAETGSLFDLKKSEVPAKNEELIGLNYNQFIKSVLLAQGEFAQFLKAKKDERGELLEKITGTGIYRQLGIAAFNRHKEENAGIEIQQNQIAALEGELLSEEEEKATTSAYKQEDEKLNNLKLQLEVLGKKLDLKKNIKSLRNQVSEKTALKENAEGKLVSFEKNHGQALARHEQLEDFAGDLRTWKQLSLELENLENDLKKIEDQQKINKQEQASCLDNASALLQQQVTSENFEASLETFANKVLSLQQQRQEKGSEFKSLANQIKAEVRDLDFSFNEANPEVGLQEIRQFQQNSSSKIERLRAEFSEEKIPQKADLQQKLQQSRLAWKQDMELQAARRALEKLQKEKEELQQKRQELIPAEKELREQVNHHQNVYDRLKLQHENQLLRAELEDLRHRLVPGEHCPLCGALEHPYAEMLPPKNDSLKEEMESSLSALEHKKNELNTLSTRLKDGAAKIEQLGKQQGELKAQIQLSEAAFQNEFAALQPGDKSWEQICDTLEENLQNLELLEQEAKKSKAIKLAIPLLEQLIKVLAEGRELKQKLEEIYGGSDVNRDCRELSNRWSSLKQEQKTSKIRLEELKNQQEAKQAKNAKLLKELLPQLQERGFKEPSQALSHLIPEAECRNLRQEREALKSAIASQKSSLEVLEQQLQGLLKDARQDSEADLPEEFQRKQAEQEALNQHCRDLYSKLKAQEQTKKRIESLQEEISKKSQQIYRWKLLKELIGDSSGKKFNDFAQDLSLSQLLYLANIRLKDLSDRYRIDKPLAGEDDGLVAIDEHMGGQRRSVKTLSGGETFLLSLSMALALSDLASRNVEINSLFIDEGFGTLDPETLDQTLDTLEKLQAESEKTIGIISHVDSLKERIATQIKLSRNGQGYSSLEVV